jgi:hypothetical protein
MKKTTSQKFSKRLTQYGALSVAIAGIAGANAQETIVYTNIADLSGSGSWLDIHMDADGIVDYQIGNFVGPDYDVLIVRPAGSGFYNSNNILGYRSGYWLYPFALASGVTISNTVAGSSSNKGGAGSWMGGNLYQTMNVNSCNFSYSNWCGENDKYLGLKFLIGANTHYGWARLDVPLAASSGSGWVLKDVAYNSTPDAPILAGQTTSLGIEDDNLSKIKIIGLNKSIGIYNLNEAANYKLFSMTGQEVLKGITNNKDYVIEASTLASGVYIVELGDTKSDAVFRKKVVLQ